MKTENVKVKTEEHKKMVAEYIQYVCDRAREKNLNVAEILFTRLEDGEYLEKEEIEQYAKENNLAIVGSFYIENELKSLKVCITQAKQVVKRNYTF